MQILYRKFPAGGARLTLCTESLASQSSRYNYTSLGGRGALAALPDADEFEDDDAESNLGSEDSLDEDKSEPKAASAPARSSRRKPAAPQWVNPDWQDDKPRRPDEVIINGVCVMRSDDFRREAEPTVRVEPSPAREPAPAAEPEPALAPDDIKTEAEDQWEY
ncbi:homeobox protein cut-like [Zerene cesonia]|uniref:homeobox protein cut-like n=1 Tax=Zerene cesonia TaxID=33412 RepID=UPI0018E502FB|nr:homeobox protein cut-like [Zerene cesonia]